MINYIRIPEELARQLHAIAEREDAELAESVGEMIEEQSDDRPWATMADLGRHAVEMNQRMKLMPWAEVRDDDLPTSEPAHAEHADAVRRLFNP